MQEQHHRKSRHNQIRAKKKEDSHEFGTALSKITIVRPTLLDPITLQAFRRPEPRTIEFHPSLLYANSNNDNESR